MAKDGNTFQKRQRETLKRQKAEEKKERRQKRKDGTAPVDDSHYLDGPDIEDRPVGE